MESFEQFLDSVQRANGNGPDIVLRHLVQVAALPSGEQARILVMLAKNGAAESVLAGLRLAIADAGKVVTNRPAGEDEPAQRDEVLTLADRLMLAPGDDDAGEPEENPLLVADLGEKLDLGWIDDYARLTGELTGAPTEFNQLAGLVTAATALERRARLRMAFGDIYANIFGCIVARSSVFHKSSCLAKPRTFLKRADREKLLLSELMTSEGLLKQLSGQPAGVILRDEIGSLFAAGRVKYLAQLKPDLTALYDCQPYSRILSNTEVKVEQPYLNILGATTPSRFFDSVALLDWQDGFLARWLFVLPSGEPNFDHRTGMMEPHHDRRIGELAMTLVNLGRREATDFKFAAGAHDLWDEWQREAVRLAYHHGDDTTAAITTRYATYALKFALILTAVNGEWGIVECSTMETSVKLADRYKAHVHALLAQRDNFGVSGSKMQKALAIIRAHTGKPENVRGVNRTTIMQYGGFTKGELEPVLQKLVEIGAVIETASSGGGWRRYIPAPNLKSLPIKAWK